MTQVRVKGYVVGYDKSGEEILWSVKVKDRQSLHNGQKFIVASCSEGMMLTKPAVDVTFKIEPIQVGREQVLRAVDVQFSGMIQAGSKRKSLSEVHETLNILVTEHDGKRSVWITGEKSREEAAKDLDRATAGEERVVDFLAFDIYEQVAESDSPEIPGAFEIIKAAAYTEHTMQGLEKLLNAVYQLGRNSNK